MKINKRIIGAVLLAVLLLVCITAQGCAEKSKAISYENVSIDEGTYKYWFMTLKSHYINTYTDIKDTDEFWDTEYQEGQTYADYMNSKIKTQISCYLVAQYLFDKYKLSLTKEDTNAINEDINSQIEYYGSKSEFNKELSKYGINVNKLKNIYTMEEKFLVLNNYLFNTDTGVEKATDDEIDAYYKENYACIKYLMVLKSKDYEYDEDGKHVTDANGYYTYRYFTEDEIKEHEEYAKSVYNAVSGGANIDDYINKDYPDLNVPNGYYVTVDDFSIHTADIIDASFDMQIGDVRLVENEDAYFILCRFELTDKAYEGADKSQFSSLTERATGEKFNDMFNSLIKDVSIDEETINKYSVKNKQQ